MTGSPDLLGEELLYEIRQHIANHPRTLQTRIGPSEIGMACARRLGHKLAGTEPDDQREAWLPTVGTAVHSWLEGAFTATNARWVAECGSPRFLLEQQVTVGQIGGVDITGHTDAYDTVTATVIDWKTCGITRLKKYRRHGPGPEYRAQAHLYGRGWAAQGRPVDTVMVVFLPRNSELRDTVVWHEPYNEQIALDALARANRVDAAVKVLGDEAYTETNGGMVERGLGVLAEPAADLDALALPLDFELCGFCPLHNNGCDGDPAGKPDSFLQSVLG